MGFAVRGLVEEMISVLIPVIRPKRAEKCIESIYKNAGLSSELIEIVTKVDKHRVGCPHMIRQLAERATFEWMAFIGDDCIMQAGCLENALKAAEQLPDGWGLVGFNDNLRMAWDRGNVNLNRAPAHWMAHKKLLPLLDGDLFHTGYKHCFCDNELAMRCAEIGRYVFCRDAMVFHGHPIFDTKYTDPDYERVYAPDVYVHDMQLFKRRMANGWK